MNTQDRGTRKMRVKMSEEGQDIVGQFQKSTNASIQVSLVLWEGTTFADVREVVSSNKPGEQFAYTRKGCRFDAKFLPELIALLEVADDHL